MKDEYQLVSLEEMRELLTEEAYKPEELEDVPAELLMDEKSKLYYTDYFASEDRNLILDHLFAEECIRHWDRLDQMRTFDAYNPYIIARIIRLYQHPLVWQKLPKKLREKYVITGRFAAEVENESRLPDDLLVDIIATTEKNRVEWFAFSFDEVKQQSCWSEEDCFPGAKPNNMPDWSLITTNFNILTATEEGESKKLHVDLKTMEVWDKDKFEQNLRMVYSDDGAEKTLEIVRALRNDWKYIIAKQLFNIDKLSAEELEEFRRFLFEGLDYEVSQWEKEVADEASQEDADTAQEEPCCLFTKKAKKEGKEAEIIEALKNAMSGRKDKARALVDEVRIWQKEGYLDSNFNAKVMYDGLKVLVSLPFLYGNFRKYYNE